jgi:diguanylate cyclase (GGDEF)-like protein
VAGVKLGWRELPVAMRAIFAVSAVITTIAVVATWSRHAAIASDAPTWVVWCIVVAALAGAKTEIAGSGRARRISASSDGLALMLAALLLPPRAALVVAVVDVGLVTVRARISVTAARLGFTVLVRVLIMLAAAEAVRLVLDSPTATPTQHPWQFVVAAAAAAVAAVVAHTAPMVAIVSLSERVPLRGIEPLSPTQLRHNTVEYLNGAVAVVMIAAAAPLALLAVPTVLLLNNSVLMAFRERQVGERDSLTGLGNRAMFMSVAEREIGRASRTHAPLSIVLLDMDHLRVINNSHGLAAGDAANQAVAACLAGTSREYDTAARIGGEEFVVVLPDTPLEAASAVANRIRREVAAVDVSHDHTTLQVTVSAGVAQRLDGEPLNRLLARADAALYAAKAGGRDRVVEASPAGLSPAAPEDHVRRSITPPRQPASSEHAVPQE